MATSDRIPVFSVARVNEYAKSLLTADPLLSDIRVRGELSNVKRHSSGHLYFSVKDSDAVLRCAFFRQDVLKCRIRLEDGMQVLLRGYVTIYPRDGAYQLVVSSAEADGEGALFALFQKRRDELAAKGLFDESRKKKLPFFPRKIAVVTSPTGAVLRDIVRVARRRWRGIGIVLLPVAVQGEGAGEQIAQAIIAASAIPDVDAVIIGRGGGSMEDLWAFNEEAVAYAIARCPKPLISAVGHETDFTIADFVADVRASTPSHAAELCVPDAPLLLERLGSLWVRAQRSQRIRMDMFRERLARAAGRPVMTSPGAFISILRERNLSARNGLTAAVKAALAAQRAGLRLLREKAAALGPLGVLNRGYALIKRGDALIISAGALAAGSDITIILKDGQGKARVLDGAAGEQL